MKYTKELFVAKATAIFDNLYDYTKFEFVNMQTKGIVTCNKCSNEWLVVPAVHISYQTHCPMCSKKNKQMSLEEFKVKAIELHKDKFDYSLIDELPNGASSKISIRCIEHNLIFKQSIRSHLEGRDTCKDCLSIKFKKTNKECFEELKTIPNYEKINFTKFEYKGDRNKITITCNDCNIDKTILYTTLKNNGFYCKCFDKTLANNFNDFKLKAKNYLKEYQLLNTYEYNGYLKPLQFKCNKHVTIFEQTPDSILRGHKGCIKCSNENNSFDKKNYIKTHKDCILYLIQLSNEKELFYKIGITHKTINKRFQNLKGYTITILYELKRESKFILDLEEHIKGCIINNDKYLPQIIFGGYTETFTVESLPKVLKFLHSIES